MLRPCDGKEDALGDVVGRQRFDVRVHLLRPFRVTAETNLREACLDEAGIDGRHVDRPPEEVESWKARDPITSNRARLEADGVPAAELDAIEAEANAKVAAAEAEARAAPEPSPDVIETQLWTDGGSSWRS